MTPPPNDEAALAETLKLLKWMLEPRNTGDTKGHGADLFKYTTPIAATLHPRTTITFRVRIPEEYGNRQGNLHGGATAMIFDNLSSVALSLWGGMVAEPDSALAQTWIVSGVTRTLNCSYLRPAPVGSEVDVLNEVVSAGKNLALVRCTMTSTETGKILTTCEHHKAAIHIPRAAL